MEGTQAKGKHRANKVAHSSLYMWANTKDLFSSVQHCYMFMFIWHLSFAKSLWLLLFFYHFLGQRQFAMGFNGFFGLFCQVLGAFWWVPIMVLMENKYTYICEEQGDRASNKVFCMCKLDCKSLLNAFGLKNCQCFLRRWQWKRKEILRMLLGQIWAW